MTIVKQNKNLRSDCTKLRIVEVNYEDNVGFKETNFWNKKLRKQIFLSVLKKFSKIRFRSKLNIKENWRNKALTEIESARLRCETAALHCFEIFEQHPGNVRAQHRALTLHDNANKRLNSAIAKQKRLMEERQ